jgi:hypothetical protein
MPNLFLGMFKNLQKYGNPGNLTMARIVVLFHNQISFLAG